MNQTKNLILSDTNEYLCEYKGSYEKYMNTVLTMIQNYGLQYMPWSNFTISLKQDPLIQEHFISSVLNIRNDNQGPIN